MPPHEYSDEVVQYIQKEMKARIERYESLSDDHYHKSPYKRGYELTLQEDFETVIIYCYSATDLKHIKHLNREDREHIHRFLRFCY